MLLKWEEFWEGKRVVLGWAGDYRNKVELNGERVCEFGTKKAQLTSFCALSQLLDFDFLIAFNCNLILTRTHGAHHSFRDTSHTSSFILYISPRLLVTRMSAQHFYFCISKGCQRTDEFKEIEKILSLL